MMSKCGKNISDTLGYRFVCPILALLWANECHTSACIIKFCYTSLVKLNWRSLPRGTLGRKDSLFRLSLGPVIKYLMMHVGSQVILSIMIMKLFKNSVQTREF